MTRAPSRRGSRAPLTFAVTLAVGALGTVTAGTVNAAPVAVPIITKVAGTGTSGTPATGPARNSPLYYPYVTATDAHGNIYVADCGYYVLKIDPAGQLTVVAGNGGSGAPVAGPATQSPVYCPTGLAVDPAGNVYISEYDYSTVEKVTPGGTLSIIAGNGSYGQPVEGPAVDTPLAKPHGLALDHAGDLIVADYDATGRVYAITPAGQLHFVAGNGTSGQPLAGSALLSPLGGVDGVAVDPSGNVYLADYSDKVMEKVTPEGQLSVLAGQPGVGGSATPGPASASLLTGPTGVAADGAGNVYVADSSANAIDKITPSGVLSVAAGSGASGAPTYGGPAASSALQAPENVAALADGTLFVADSANYTIDRIGLATPGPVGDIAITPGDTTGTVTFTPPQDSGTAAITGYEVSTDGGHTWHPAAVVGTDPLTVHLRRDWSTAPATRSRFERSTTAAPAPQAELRH